MPSSLKRIILLAAAAIVLLVLAALTVAGYYLNSSAFRQWVLASANARFNGTIAFAAHRLTPLGGRLRLQQVELRDSDGVVLFSADRVTAEIAYSALLKRVLHFRHIASERAFVNLAFDEQDRLRFAALIADAGSAAPPAAEKGTGWQVVIAEMSARASVVDYQRPATGWSGQIAGADLKGRLDLRRGSGEVRLTAEHIAWQGPDRTGNWERVRIEAAYRPEAATPMQLAVAVPEGRFDFAGAFTADAARPRVTGVFDFDLALSAVQAWLPPATDLGGRATGRLTLRGEVFDPQADLAVTILNGRAYGVPFERLDGNAELHQRQLTIVRLHGSAPGGEAELNGRIDLRPLFPSDLRTFQRAAPPYTLTLAARRIQPAKIPVRGWAWEGIYDADVWAEGSGWEQPDRHGRAEIGLKLQGARAVAGGRPLDGALTGQLEWRGRDLLVSKSRLALGPNSAALEGRFDFEANQMDVRVDLSLARLAELGPPLGVALPAGRATLRLSAAGNLARPTVEAQVEAHDLEYAGWQAQRLNTELRLAPDGVLNIERLDLQQDGSVVTGTGRIDLWDQKGVFLDPPPLSAALDLRNVRPALVGLRDVEGALNGRLELGNSLFDPTARLRLAESPLRWQALTVNARGEAIWQAGRLTIRDLKLERLQSGLHIAGSIAWRDSKGGWTSKPLIDLRLNSKALRLQDVSDRFSGSLAVEADVRGRPSDLHGNFNFTGGPIDLGFQKALAFSARGRLAGARIEVEHASATLAPGQIVRGSGWYGWNQEFEIALEADAIALHTLQFLNAGETLKGRLHLQAAGKGTLQEPHLEAQLTIRAPQFRERAFDDVHLQAQLSGQRLAVSADLNFQVQALWDLGGGDFNVKAEFARTDLAPYLRLATDKALSGQLTGRLDLSGNRRSPLALNGQLALSEILVAYQDTPVLNARKVHIGIRDGAVTASGVRLDLAQGGYLELNAGGDLRKDLSAQITGRVPLVSLAVFSETLTEAEGAVGLNAHVRGPAQALEWQAEIDFEQVSFVIPQLLQSVQGLNGRVRLGVDQLAVEKLAGGIETGSFSLDGTVDLQDWQPVNGRLRLHAQALPLYWPETADFLVSGDLELTGDMREAQLAGKVILLEGLYYKDFRLNLLAVVSEGRRRPAIPAVPDRKPEWMRRIALSVELSHRYPFMVDNNIAQLTVAPDLKIGGTLADPLISGRAEVLEGEIIYRRKSFAVTRGVVDFVHLYKTEPTLDIAAESTIGNYEVSLAVSGTPDKLAFTLHSDPPLSDNDILSLILVGRTTEELSTRGSGPSTQQMLGSLLATAWGEDIRQRTGVDILEVETGPQSGQPRGPEDRVQVTLGKRLSPRLTVKYEVETAAGERVQRAVSEYRFMENLFAKGFQDTQGKYGGEMLFRLEFR